MKNFVRKETLFSLCGLNCGLCTMRIGGYCPGCGGGEGNQSCSIAKCSIEHGKISFCFACEEYPCARYKGMDEYDSFIPHRNRKKDFAKAQEMGIEAYIAELRRKMDLLDEFLEQYNDGRRKTFFATAVYLLELCDLQDVLDSLKSREDICGLPIKEKALAAVQLLQDKADSRGISLKLVKKPKKEK